MEEIYLETTEGLDLKFIGMLIAHKEFKHEGKFIGELAIYRTSQNTIVLYKMKTTPVTAIGDYFGRAYNAQELATRILEFFKDTDCAKEMLKKSGIQPFITGF